MLRVVSLKELTRQKRMEMRKMEGSGAEVEDEGEGIGLTEVTEQQMEDKLKQLQEESKSYQTQRFQELFVAFALGGLSLVASLLAFRVCTKPTTDSNAPTIGRP